MKWQNKKSLGSRFYPIKNKQTKLAYEINNDLLLLSLSSLIPPLRYEIIIKIIFTHFKWMMVIMYGFYQMVK
jgi:hypothetical protein